MRRYQKWALTLGIMAATPGIATAAGPLSLLKPKAAAESAASSATKQSNQKVADEIGRALKGAQLKGFDIEIEYKNGVAILSGKIADARQKAQATRLASEIAGVKRVDNQLTVLQGAGAQAAGRGAAPTTRPRSMIRQVSGEVAEAAPAAGPSPTEMREAATTAAIQNNQKVAQDVANALQAAHLNGYDIEVQYQNGAALLQGTVASPEHRAMAHKVASEVPGVRMVSNQLAVQAQPGAGPEQAGQQMPPQMRQIAPAGYLPQGGPGMPPEPSPAGAAGQIYDNPNLPDYAWPTYADYPNYAQVAYPQQYSASAWPYIGPFYPYPQVPLGWRRVTLEWDDGAWNLDFNSRTDKWWWFLHPKNW